MFLTLVEEYWGIENETGRAASLERCTNTANAPIDLFYHVAIPACTAVAGEVRILPMMYLALSYDHQVIDGKEAVQFLVTIKELLEDPTRLLLEI